MWRLATRTLPTRVTSYLVSGGVIATGTALLTGFAALLDTGLAAPDPDGETLTTIAIVLGGWTSLLVVFAVATTVGLGVRHRETELALLRGIGATGGQTRRLVLLETVVAAIPMIGLGALAGHGLARLLRHLLVDGGVITAATELSDGWASTAPAMLTAAAATVIGGWLAGRRAARISPVRALAESHDATDGSGLPPARLLAGLLALACGLGLSVTTAFRPDDEFLAATAGPACVWTAIGLALLCPVFVRPLAALARVLPTAGSRLAGRHLAARPRELAAVVAPLSLLVGIGCGTLYMQSTENAVRKVPAGAGDLAVTVETLNYVVVAMVIAFCAVAVVNTLVAVTRRRRAEFGLLRLVAARPGQVLTVVTVEATAAAILSWLLGSLAAAATVIPYSLVKLDSAVPEGPVWTYPAVLSGALLIAVGTTVATAAAQLRARPAAAALA